MLGGAWERQQPRASSVPDGPKVAERVLAPPFPALFPLALPPPWPRGREAGSPAFPRAAPATPSRRHQGQEVGPRGSPYKGRRGHLATRFLVATRTTRVSCGSEAGRTVLRTTWGRAGGRGAKRGRRAKSEPRQRLRDPRRAPHLRARGHSPSAPSDASPEPPFSPATLEGLDSLPCYRSWSAESANFYDAKVGEGGAGLSPASCKAGAMSGAVLLVEEPGLVSGSHGGGGGSSSRDLAELSAAAPAMYEDESAIDFSSYIDSMAAVPNLELCNDELFLDLFNSNHKGGERGGGGGNQGAYGDYLPPPPPQPAPQAAVGGVGALASLLHASVPPGPLRGAVKQEPEWGDESLLPSQIATCAQTIVNLSGGQPTPPTSPEPPGSASPSSYSSRCSSASCSSVSGKERPGKKCVDRFSPEYRQRRERNNIAVRKSRDKAKRRNQEMQQKLVELSAENERLHKKVEQLSRDLSSLRHFFKQHSFLQHTTTTPPGATDCR